MALYLGNDHRVGLSGLKNGFDGSLLAAATVDLTVLDSAGVTPVGGVAWPVSLDPVTGVAGSYAAKLPKEADISVGVDYTVRLVISDSGTGLDGEFDRLERCERRQY